MKLYEFEGHELFKKAGLACPSFIVLKSTDDIKKLKGQLKYPVVAKVQVLSGRRGKAGGVKVCRTEAELAKFVGEYLSTEFVGEKVQFIGVFEKIDIDRELYASITYDTVARQPFLLFNEKGGVEIEEQVGDLVKIYFDVNTGPTKTDVRKIALPYEFVAKMWQVFCDFDARQVEVNPIAKTKRGDFVALDAKVILDDNGLARHEDLNVIFKGAIGAVPTKRELEAKKIDSGDYRGSAGSAFIELDGDIAILASGGGASLLIMDAVVAAGGKPANYTEYSGNPSREKVAKLTQVVLNKKGLTGVLVCGAVANFTDIYETLCGFVDGLRSVSPKVSYPIVIRRGGPRVEEAYQMLARVAKKEGYDIHMFGAETPISVAAKKMVELTNKYKVKGQG